MLNFFWLSWLANLAFFSLIWGCQIELGQSDNQLNSTSPDTLTVDGKNIVTMNHSEYKVLSCNAAGEHQSLRRLVAKKALLDQPLLQSRLLAKVPTKLIENRLACLETSIFLWMDNVLISKAIKKYMHKNMVNSNQAYSSTKIWLFFRSSFKKLS